MKFKVKYNSLAEWAKAEPNAYYSAKYRTGLIDEICLMFGWTKTVKNPIGYWTQDLCFNEALKYKTIKDWARESSASYDAAKRYGWTKICSSHMIELMKPVGYWTFDKCKEDALNYKSRTEWAKKSSGAYSRASDNGWINQCCQHMNMLIKHSGYWSLEICKADALLYKSISEWIDNSPTAYHKSKKMGWFKECSSHMLNNFHTLERCKQDALNYINKQEWRKKSKNIYQAAQKRGWLSECCSHMELKLTNSEFWGIDLCKKDALKYETQKAWRLNNVAAYRCAKNNNWIEDCCQHMSKRRIPKNIWLEKCKIDALKYTNKKDWAKKSKNLYKKAQKYGFIKICSEHMNHENKI